MQRYGQHTEADGEREEEAEKECGQGCRQRGRLREVQGQLPNEAARELGSETPRDAPRQAWVGVAPTAAMASVPRQAGAAHAGGALESASWSAPWWSTYHDHGGALQERRHAGTAGGMAPIPAAPGTTHTGGE